MIKKRVPQSEIDIGSPLKWNVYDRGGSLLLKKGSIVSSVNQIEGLVSRGLFVDATVVFDKAPSTLVSRSQDNQNNHLSGRSVVQLLEDAYTRLQYVIADVEPEIPLAQKISEIVDVIVAAINMDPDVSLGSILFNQNGEYNIKHCIDSAVVCCILSRSMNYTPEDTASVMSAALTMNLSMQRSHDSLQHSDGAITDVERYIMQGHPKESVALLMTAKIKDTKWLSTVLLHHENEDGTGYPNGKKGEEIPEYAKILMLADRYCARICARAHKRAVSPTSAMRDMMVTDKQQLDPVIFTAFIRELGIYPIGSFVKLATGEIAIVSRRRINRKSPFVHALVSSKSELYIVPIQRDTSQKAYSIVEVLSKDRAGVAVQPTQIWGKAAAS